MNTIKNKRVGNLEFRPATYLCETPKFPNFDIVMWYPNPYYGRESEYNKNGTSYYPKGENSCNFSIHESCFKNPESCYVVGSFVKDSECDYEFHFLGDRPLGIPKNCRDDFWELIEYGYKNLTNVDEHEDNL